MGELFRLASLSRLESDTQKNGRHPAFKVLRDGNCSQGLRMVPFSLHCAH